MDAIVERMAAAARANAKRLADLAVEETGYGNAKDKYIKNLLCCDWLPRRMRGIKTVGILRELPEEKLVEIGVSLGVVAAILPTTNPTSTAIYKILISLKAGNAVVHQPASPRASLHLRDGRGFVPGGARGGRSGRSDSVRGHRHARRHQRADAARTHGGHPGHRRARHGEGRLFRAASRPSAWVPAMSRCWWILRPTWTTPIAKIVAGKSFDYGTVCSSEQAIVAEAPLRDRILALLKAHKAYIATEAQKDALGKLLITTNWTVNPQCVGQAPTKIAKMAGFEVPPDTSIICAELSGVGKQHPLSAEKLSPVLSLYFVKDFAAAMDTCFALLKFGGAGHTDGDLRQGRCAHPRLRHAHAGLPGAGEHARAAGVHRHHHQRFSLDDAGLRSAGGQQHLRQCRPAAPDQHQAAGLRGAQAGRSLRDAAGLRCRAGAPSGPGGGRVGRAGGPRGHRGGGGALSGLAGNRGGGACFGQLPGRRPGKPRPPADAR